jgi:signal transduction histidine kinase
MHDFKTPLSIIRNYSEAINDGILDEENITEYSKEIIREVDRLNALVMDILQLSKLQGGGYTLKKEHFDINEFLTDCSSKFSLISNQKNIELQIKAPKILVYGDSNYLYRVVYNFIDNALKFSFKDTKIEISATQLEGSVRVAVKNIGIGIEKELIQDVWNRYYKQNKSGGMGLGLAICSEILKLHGFSYGINSTPNVETEFYFIIPLV